MIFLSLALLLLSVDQYDCCCCGEVVLKKIVKEKAEAALSSYKYFLGRELTKSKNVDKMSGGL